MGSNNSQNTLNRCLVGLYEKALPHSYTLREKLLATRQHGYDFMELSLDETDEKIARLKGDGARELAGLVHETGTPVLTMCLSGNRRFPIGSEDDDIRNFGIQMIRDAVDYALVMGIRIVQLAGYDEYYNTCDTPATNERFRTALYEAVEYAAARAVMLAIENVDTSFMNDLRKINRYIEEVNSPWLKIYPDIANLRAAGLSNKEVLQNMRETAGNIIAWHIKDGKKGVLREVNYGDGIVDFPAFFGELHRQGFQGLMVMEMWAQQNSDPIAYLDTAREFLKSCMHNAK